MHYPHLGQQFALRAQVSTHENLKEFSLLTPDFAIYISEDMYRLLSLCNGQSSLGEILSFYTPDSLPNVEAAIQSELFNKVVQLDQQLNIEGFKPYQVTKPSTHLIKLRTLLFHTTNRCNFRCEHCYHNDYVSPSDLTTAEADYLFREAAKNNVEQVILSGGEPFLRKDLLELTKSLSQHYVSYQINTNGSLITRDHALELQQTRLVALSISMDGPNAETHNEIRKDIKSWQKIMDLLPMLSELGLPLRIGTMLTKLWLKDLKQIDHFIDYLNQFSIRHWSISLPSPTGEAYNDSFKNEYKLSSLEIITLSKYILKQLQTKQPKNISNVTIANLFDWYYGQESSVIPTDKEYSLDNTNNILCDIHKDMLMIEPDGIVPFCSLFKSRFPMVIGNLREESLHKIWEKLCEIRIKHSIPQRTHCTSCNLLKYCGGGCPGTDPSPNTNFLNTCDMVSKSLLPHIIQDYDYVLEKKSMMGL